mmetsp:Transcript_41709/g.126542  ORF Transcript_41709/g.126542 Transcript_41709/m.126542 type:complete len:1858 (-) Transcript_41709:76-5649(-)
MYTAVFASVALMVLVAAIIAIANLHAAYLRRGCCGASIDLGLCRVVILPIFCSVTTLVGASVVNPRRGRRHLSRGTASRRLLVTPRAYIFFGVLFLLSVASLPSFVWSAVLGKDEDKDASIGESLGEESVSLHKNTQSAVLVAQGPSTNSDESDGSGKELTILHAPGAKGGMKQEQERELTNNVFQGNKGKTLFDIIESNENFSTLADFLEEDSDLRLIMDGKGPLTVFAPTNYAFKKLKRKLPKVGVGSYSDLKQSGILHDVFLLHIVQNGAYESTDLVANNGGRMNTMNGEVVNFKVNKKNRIRVSGARVGLSDFVGSNGIIHGINDVLLPSSMEEVVQSGPAVRPMLERSCGLKPRIHVVTHARDFNDVFWNTWRDGAEAASSESAHVTWDAVGYDVEAAVRSLANACNSSEAIVVTVPYAEGTEQYELMDQAINKCIAMGKPIFTTNTDTYHNDNVYAYVGSSNYDIGVKCAMSLLYPDDSDIITGRKPEPQGPSTLVNSSLNLQVFWDATDMLNAGISRRLDGLNKTLHERGVELNYFLPTGNSKCPCANTYPNGVTDNEGEGLRMTIDTIRYQYPPRYGMDTCSQHDRDKEPSCHGSNPPAFCELEWCYVDRDNCDLSFVTFDLESVGEYIWSDFPGQELPYSYETCGNINRYEDFLNGVNDGANSNEEGFVVGDDTLTIVLSSNWAPKFLPDVFICGEETVDMPGVPQYGQSPFMQGLNAVSAAVAAAVSVAKNLPWKATKGNAATVASSEALSMTVSPEIKMHLSKHGKAVINVLEQYGVERGITWDIWHDAVFDSDWILQHPPSHYLGKPSDKLPVPEVCTEDDPSSGRTCDKDFQLFECSDSEECRHKPFCRANSFGPTYKKDECPAFYEQALELFNIIEAQDEVCDMKYFEKGMCKPVLSTVKAEGGTAKNLCVGHSYEFYERLYQHIIQAEEFVDITSLDSYDMIGTVESDGAQFTAMIRNALSYLASTGREIHVKFHFGSALFVERAADILEIITRDFKDDTDTKMTVWVNTYLMYTPSSWNHGKIVAVDGKKLITGGSNYYTTDYLQEDPVHDVSMQVTGGPALTAHRYAEKLWRTSCEWWGLHELWNGVGIPPTGVLDLFFDAIDIPPPTDVMGGSNTAWRAPDGVYHKSLVYGEMHCPPAYDDISKLKPEDQRSRPKTGVSVIPAARLAGLGDNIQGGSHTSDLALLALMESAQVSIKISQQDMLPLLLAGPASLAIGHGGYDYNGGVSKVPFDDTWRIIGGIAKAMARNVPVYIMVSAPCAFAANNPNCVSEGLRTNTFQCIPGQGNGYDYWGKVFNEHSSLLGTGSDFMAWDRWPEPRDIDLKDRHIKDGDPFAHRSLSERNEQKSMNTNRRLVYGYGWSLDNIADWLFAYYMINKKARPISTSGAKMTATEIAQHICTYAHIGHVRLTADSPTYTRGNYPGGQVGNHAKILMVDDHTFYMGSDNAYGSGLAEFGLITDDADKAAEFNERYWEPLWTEAVGTENAPGLVSGSSRASMCPWFEQLKNRGPPWNDLQASMCSSYLNGQECEEVGCHWVNLARSFTKCTWTPAGKSCTIEQSYCTGYKKKNKSWCLEDVECGSGRCSKNLVCEDKLDKGEHCWQHNDCKDGWCSTLSGLTCNYAGIENGYNCLTDEQCLSGRCANTLTCKEKLADGNSCFEDEDCESDKCTTTFACGWLEDEELCGFDDDCLSDHCNNVFHCGKMKNGNGCLTDGDCKSGRCNILFTCRDLLNDGESCGVSNNCKAGYCTNTFVCGRRSDGEKCVLDDDCKGNHCNGQFQCGKLGNGNLCLTDSDCHSGRCSNTFQCAGKLPYDSLCTRHSDCQSNSCRTRWKGWALAWWCS